MLPLSSEIAPLHSLCVRNIRRFQLFESRYLTHVRTQLASTSRTRKGNKNEVNHPLFPWDYFMSRKFFFQADTLLVASFLTINKREPHTSKLHS